ncbi:MAG: hypothetical protein ACQKBU_02050 [Verrucomicrobiales bacterium]
MVPPIITLVFACGVAFLAYSTTTIDTGVESPAPVDVSMDSEVADEAPITEDSE